MSTPAVTLPPPAARHQPLDAIPALLWIRLGLVFFLLGGVAWLLGPSAGPEDWWLHGLWCFAGLAVALPTLLRAFRQGFAVVLTDHRLMFLAAFSLYFLFGPALLAVGPEIQVEAAQSYYPIGAREALRVDAVNGFGFGLALLSAALARGRWLGAQAARVAARAAGAPAHAVVGLFLLLGTAAAMYLLSFDLGFREGVVSGLVRSAGQLSLVAIFLAAAHRGRGEWGLRVFGVALAVILAISGTLQFNKLGALLPLAALIAGLSLRFGSRRVLPLGLTLLVAGYLLLGNLAIYGRSSVGYQGAASLAERWQILLEGWQNTRDLSEDEEYGTWARLCYVPPQAAALDFQDAGQGGDGFNLMFWVLVPRLVAPEKPEITKTGREFHEKITGYESSSTGQGIFASGYYHGGWWGFCLASVLCGWILAQTSAIARAIMTNHALLMLPFCLLGLYIAFRIDGDFIADYVGPFVLILYPILAASFFLSVARPVRRQSAKSSKGERLR